MLVHKQPSPPLSSCMHIPAVLQGSSHELCRAPRNSTAAHHMEAGRIRRFEASCCTPRISSLDDLCHLAGAFAIHGVHLGCVHTQAAACNVCAGRWAARLLWSLQQQPALRRHCSCKGRGPVSRCTTGQVRHASAGQHTMECKLSQISKLSYSIAVTPTRQEEVKHVSAGRHSMKRKLSQINKPSRAFAAKPTGQGEVKHDSTGV